MNWDELKDNWRELRGSAKKQWSKLTDLDLDNIEGSRDKLIGRLQKAYGKEKAAIQKEVDAWLDRL